MAVVVCLLDRLSFSRGVVLFWHACLLLLLFGFSSLALVAVEFLCPFAGEVDGRVVVGLVRVRDATAVRYACFWIRISLWTSENW